MLVDDAFEHFFGTGMVPDPVGPDDRDRPGGTDLQAVRLGPLHTAAARQAELLEAFLEVFPRALADLAAAAFLLLGQGADENVPFDCAAADLGQRGFGLRQLRPRGRRAQRFLPAIRAISAWTIRSTIAGKCRSSHCANIGLSISRTSPSSDVSPERTICG